jgi:predicted ATPase
MFVPPADVSATDIATRNSAGPDQQSFIERKDAAIQQYVIISGCSGGGKSTLLAELGGRGFATVEEPGRRIVREELAGDGSALPWVNAVAFTRRAIAMSLWDMAIAAPHHGWVFFDRGLIDAAVALQHLLRRAGTNNDRRPSLPPACVPRAMA